MTNDNSVSLVRSFPISHVRLLDSAFKRARDVNATFLMNVDADRLLVPFRREAGLPAKAETYLGWEARGINGHSLGHYLSALAYLYGVTGDAAVKQRVDYVVAELAACQDADGALLPVPRRIYDEIREHKIDASPFSLNGAWVPNYTVHKLFAGLRDAYRQAGNADALEIERRLGSWLADVLAPLDATEIQTMLRAEHGGMNEVFADLAADTGEAKFLEISERCFNQNAVLDPLFAGRDELNGLHGNTQIPKIIGLARQYELSGEARFRHAAETFWNAVVNDRSFAMGGHSDSEHFFPPADFPKHLSPVAAETCNTYNMLKLTAHLFAWQPDASKMDFVERAMLNHLLANIGQQPGEYGYFFSLASPAVKVFSEPASAWWCCVGTGMENPQRYGEQIYSHDDDSIWINLFIASTVQWDEKGVSLTQSTAFPDSDTTRLTIDAKAPVTFTLRVRHPHWCAVPVVTINGQRVETTSTPSSYLSIHRTWNAGDVVEIRLPMQLRLEALPHANDKIAAVLYGPLMLAGLVPVEAGASDPGKLRFSDHLQAKGRTNGFAPVLVAPNPESILSDCVPTGAAFGEFRADGVVKPVGLTFVPLHRIYEEHYAPYFTLMTPAEWTTREAELVEAQRLAAARAAETLDELTPGYQQPEVEHNVKSHLSDIVEVQNRKGRRAGVGGSFSYDVSVDPDAPIIVIATYWGAEAGQRTFDVSIDATVVANPDLRPTGVAEFWDESYGIPPALTRGKRKVTVRFAARPGSTVAAIYGVRVIRAE